MKHVYESLNQYYDYKFFKMFEEYDKSNLKDKESDGLKIIDKIINNFDDFKKDAKGEILKFKEFWEENQKAKKMFPEPGAIYKLHDSDYAVGILELPVELNADGEIEGGLGAFPEDEEEIIEGPELEPEEEKKEEFFEEQEVPNPTNEAEESEDDIDLDLDLDVEDEEGEDLDSPDNQLDDIAPEEPVDDVEVDSEVDIETPVEEPSEPANLTQEPQTYFVVYDLSGDERDEIFRCGSNNVVNSFKDFYNDKFKGSMKNAILQYKEQKEKEKAEAEKAEKKKAEKEKETKLDKFLGEEDRKIEYLKKTKALNEEYVSKDVVKTTVDYLLSWYAGDDWAEDWQTTNTMSVNGNHAQDDGEDGMSWLTFLEEHKDDEIEVEVIDAENAYDINFTVADRDFFIQSAFPVFESLNEAEYYEDKIEDMVDNCKIQIYPDDLFATIYFDPDGWDSTREAMHQIEAFAEGSHDLIDYGEIEKVLANHGFEDAGNWRVSEDGWDVTFDIKPI